MADQDTLTPERHRELVEAYVRIRPCYCTYAAAFKRVMEQACAVSFPQALVQSRAKSVSSYAEKLVRKFPKTEFMDLCGGRVIVQTTEQVRSVRRFIEASFKIVEKEDKGLLLGQDKFGYRDMHYIVQVKPERAKAIGFTDDEVRDIGEFKAEIQVRTWVQHAWADTLHDRIYKNKLEISDELHRMGALLAALMEEGDRSFARLTDSLDSLIANYTTLASRIEIAKEISIQQLILENEPENGNKPRLALGLARLEADLGNHARVVELLSPYVTVPGAIQSELLLTLGYNQCKLHRELPESADYQKGIGYIEMALAQCISASTSYVPNLRKQESQHARILSRLAWALEVIEERGHEARDHYRVAHEKEPANPYYLADVLGFELYCEPHAVLPASMRATIFEGIRSCREHAQASIELPLAYFTAGRLSLLAGQGREALGYYALGIRYCNEGTHCVEPDAIDMERRWVVRTSRGVKPPPEHQDVLELLRIGKLVAQHARGECPPPEKTVLIVSGGAASMTVDMIDKIRPMLEDALEGFTGTVISGGTTSGVPGCVGDVARTLASRCKKRFRLTGYLPTRLPLGISEHDGYDQPTVKVGRDFLPEQILQCWSDLLKDGIHSAHVLLLGFGGGTLSAVEYRIALGLGATVAIVAGTLGAADQLLEDKLWLKPKQPNLYPLAFDSATVRAFVVRPDKQTLETGLLTAMAKEFHSQYRAGSTSRLPPNLRPWDALGPSFQRANLEQALYSLKILEGAGFEVCSVQGKPTILTFNDTEVAKMAELEHGRWNIERLSDGWRYGKQRDDTRKIHDCLVSWQDLQDNIKHYDWDAVKAFPKILALVGLEVRRKSETG